MPLRVRNQVLLAKIESPAGEDASPAVSADEIRTGIVSLGLDPRTNEIPETSGSLDGSHPIVGGMTVSLNFPVFIRGSGAAGTAPEVGTLLKACGMAETITATAVPVADEDAADGSATTLTLGTNAAATAQLYQGMPLLLTDNPAAGATSFITDYTSGKVATLADTFDPALDNTTDYQIPVNVLYSPASTSIPSLTIYLYEDGILYKVLGCRGTFTIELTAGGIPVINFTFTGKFSSKTDVSVPTPAYDTPVPPAWKDAPTLVNRLATAMQRLTIDMGNTLANPDNPNDAEAFDTAIITERNMRGSMNPQAELVATQDIMGDFRASTSRIIHTRWGSSAGNRFGLTVPEARYLNQTPTDREGLRAHDVPFAPIGADSGAFLCFY